MELTSLEIKGLKELDQELKDLPLKLQKKALQDAVKAGAKVIKEEVVKRTPVRTKEWEKANYGRPPGTLKRKGFSVMQAKKAPKGVIAYNVVANKKYGWYAWWVEKGHQRVNKKKFKGTRYKYTSKYTGKTKTRYGKVVGFVQAKPFAVPGLQAGAGRAIEVIKNTVAKYINEYKPDNIAR